MRNVLRIVAVIVAMIGGADLAMAQSRFGGGVVTGTQQNAAQVLHTPVYSGGYHAFARAHRWHHRRHRHYR